MNNLRKLKRREHLLTEGVEDIKKMKLKLKNIKEHYIIITLKIAVKKQKLRNMTLLKKFLEENLLIWSKKLKIAKDLKKKKLYSLLFSKLTELQNEVMLFDKNNELIKRRKLLISNSFLDNLTHKMEKMKETFNEEFQSIFTKKKSDINDMFSLFKIVKIIKNQEPLEEFMNNLKYIFRDTILKICKEKIIPFTKEKITFIINDINENKFSIFKNYSIKEHQFFNCIPEVLRNLTIIPENYNSYMNSNSDDIKKLLYDKREEFFLIFEKKISKVIYILFNEIPNIQNNSFSNKKNFYMILCLINVFSEYLKKEFEINESVHIKKLLKDLIFIQTNAIIKIHIKKTGILLQNDNLKRLALQDNNEIFSDTKNEVPLYFKKYLTIFNKEAQDYIKNIKNESHSKYETVKDLFDNMSEKLGNFFSVKNNNNDTSVQILSKKLDNSKMIISTSSYSVLKSYKELIDNVILFDSISYDMYINLFIIGDYFILSAVNLLTIKKSYLSQVFQLINVEELKEKKNLVEIFPYVLFLKNFKHMRLLLLIARDNLSKIYECGNVDFLNNLNNDDTDSKNVYFPKLNNDLSINPSNTYSLLIESIVIIESIISIYKYIKKLRINIKDENEEQKKFIDDKIELYKKATYEIRLFIYRPLCYNIFKMDPIFQKIYNQKWVLNEDDNLDFSDASPFIHSLLDEMDEKYDKLNVLSGGSLTIQSQLRFYDIFIKFVVDNLQTSFCLIKNINTTGRSLFLKDIKIFKMKLEEKFKEYKKKIKIEEIFGKISLFLNSWYSNENDLIQYIKETYLDYKYMNAIYFKGEHFIKLNKKEKENFLKKVNGIYMEILQEINNDLLNNYSNKKKLIKNNK